jgi:hypothetical protein
LSSSSTRGRLLIKQRPAQQHSLQGAVPGSLQQVGPSTGCGVVVVVCVAGRGEDEGVGALGGVGWGCENRITLQHFRVTCTCHTAHRGCCNPGLSCHVPHSLAAFHNTQT